MILENYSSVLASVEKACRLCGRDPSGVKLLSVSKFQETAKMEELLAAGITEFGENYVQELCQKAGLLPEAKFHMIGHLQRNKVKALMKVRPVLIESVDSERLALALQEAAKENGITQEILIQINSGNEENKTGLSFEEVLPFAEKIISGMPNLRLKGLMVVAPQVAASPESSSAASPVPDSPMPDTLEDIRPFFHKANEIFQKLKLMCATADTLSMGMTHDFTVAIEEGSTQIRVGTAIFGARHV